jgi:hypothetical protein
MEYKYSSGTTSNLHRHLQNKHPTKLDVEDKNKGSMDKFIVNAIPVSFEFLYYFFFIYNNGINKKIYRSIVQKPFVTFSVNGLFVMINLLLL